MSDTPSNTPFAACRGSARYLPIAISSSRFAMWPMVTPRPPGRCAIPHTRDESRVTSVVIVPLDIRKFGRGIQGVSTARTRGCDHRRVRAGKCSTRAAVTRIDAIAADKWRQRAISQPPGRPLEHFTKPSSSLQGAAAPMSRCSSNMHAASCKEYRRPLDQPLAWKGCGSSREWGAPLAAEEKKRKEFERYCKKRAPSPSKGRGPLGREEP